MLLYDRVLNHAHNLLKRCPTVEHFGQKNLAMLLMLKSASVYEISECADLLSDWEKGSRQSISKRPPTDSVWCEWTFSERDHTGDFVINLGAIIWRFDKRQLTDLLDDHFEADCEKAKSDMTRSLDVSNEVYLTFTFFRFLKCDVSLNEDITQGVMNDPNKLYCDPEKAIWLGSENFSKVDSFKLGHVRHAGRRGLLKSENPSRQLSAEDTLFDLPAVIAANGGDNLPLFRPWPAFLSFALLHCKNIVTEEHTADEKTQRRAAKAGELPRVTYKTLKIEVPKSAQTKQSIDGDEEGPKTRFHLCSGHFKNLQSERYKSKGWRWWPAHWRGSKELGEVHKTDSMQPKSEGI